jgi:CTP-dependent riboflavin kinase
MYQDVWADGVVLSRGSRECAGRFSVIAAQLATLRKPFSVLDLGAAGGYFAVRLAEEFGAAVLAVDTHAVPECSPSKGSVRSIVQTATPQSLRDLGSFDVILALSVLHHCEDWRGVLAQLRGMARSALIVETPHKSEVLRRARWRERLGIIDDAVSRIGSSIGTAPGIYQQQHARKIRIIPGAPLRLGGVVETGGGNHSVFSAQFAEELDPLLGYRMVHGSLNLRLPRVAHVVNVLGPPAFEFGHTRQSRHDSEPKERLYQYWPAKIQGQLCHVMRPGNRGHGPNTVEIVAPVHLRSALSLRDGRRVGVEVYA